MDKVILLRYGEIYLKGKNRGFFERALIRNINDKLKGLKFDFISKRGRYIISGYDLASEEEIISRLKTVFGLHSLSVAFETDSDIDKISEVAKDISDSKGTFKVVTHRADKTFTMTSVEISKKIGGDILDANSQLKVDLFNPEFTVNIDLREDGKTYVYSKSVPCANGMPVGCAGKGLLLLSGGIDSPVAGYMMAKRGLKLDALHFHSYPYTSEMAKEKVRTLSLQMKNYLGSIRLIFAPFTKIQEEIHKCCHSSYMITLVRCCMMRIAEKVAEKFGCGCIVNGESLGQVASQTLESITVTNSQIQQLPIFRPLIGMDKDEIIAVSKKIGTYETSILPYEDCCTVFLPDSPITRPKQEHVAREMDKIKDIDSLIADVLDNLEIVEII